MITYFLNCMGPISVRWYEENNIPYRLVRKYNSIVDREIEFKEYLERWYVGRIDVSGVPDEPYGIEYSAPMMSGRSWYRLGEFLHNLRTEEVLSFKEIIERFEKEIGPIVWWKKKK